MSRKYVRTPEEIEQELHTQVIIMRTSCALWDAGMYWEAKRIASAIYLLVHDGRGAIRSILTQLKQREQIDYLSTASLVTERTPITLVMYRVRDKQVRFIPLCMDPVKWSFFRDLTFSEWWKEPIFCSSKGVEYSRWQIVLAFRNKDGGGHYDHVIDDDVYVELRGFDGGNNFHWMIQNYSLPLELNEKLPDGRIAVPYGPDSIIRQIAWELDFSLGRAALVSGSPQYSTAPPVHPISP